ncbi:hypothetical protein CAL14_10920 [Bordetella genomosp. 9]|uniref:hypothetical protein n=1 Tax=Bordetella genomosp. 9 TaxID=1416803 RepID=UPI000A293755|nr:hypothetical protein [Bordetella genomosp. 9]ARP90740.1 hypothetical protein CAL14_10920 [Bordetella genomosp. 9]
MKLNLLPASTQRYASLTPDERRETLIVTGTNDSRNALNDAAHEALGLAGRGFTFEMLTRRDSTQAEQGEQSITRSVTSFNLNAIT